MDPKAKLTDNFRYGEFACSCGCSPTPEIIERMTALAKALEAVRAAVGEPIKVISGYRCEKHNSTIPKAAKFSQHIQANAVDFQVTGWSGKQLRVLLELLIKHGEIPEGGIGIYPDRPATCHYDQRGKRARW